MCINGTFLPCECGDRTDGGSVSDGGAGVDGGGADAGPEVNIPPTFEPRQLFATGTSPISVDVADFNGDGKPDIATANHGSGDVSVLLNTTAPGATTPSFAAQQTFATAAGGYLAIGDFNADGKPDLAVASYGGDTIPNTVSVLLNTTPTGAATASFADHQNFTTGAVTESVAVADFNGDGKPDIVAVNNGNNFVSVLLNTTASGAATPSFAAQQTFIVINGTTSVATGDFNGDGKPDLVIGNQVGNVNSGSVIVLPNTTPDGATSVSFGSPHFFLAGAQPQFVAVADINGDGKADVMATFYMAARPSGAAAADNVAVLLNTTPTGSDTPTFAAAQRFSAFVSSSVSVPSGSGATPLAAYDLNADGKPDLVVSDFNNGTISVMANSTSLGATTLSFGPVQSFSASAGFPVNPAISRPGPWSIASGDFNGDGKPDLAIADYNAEVSNVAVLLNTTAAATP